MGAREQLRKRGSRSVRSYPLRAQKETRNQLEILMLKKDSLKLGLILGILAPVVGMTVYYLAKFRLFSVADFFRVLLMQKSLISGMVSLSLIANAIIFTIYIN